MVIYGSIACGCLIEFQRKEKNQAHIAPVCSLTQTENTLILTKWPHWILGVCYFLSNYYSEYNTMVSVTHA